ncbi:MULTISPECIES: hypothetical protein [Virgibacillus]|uniref:Uncharacterized protein n=2 Tax=Virgibacillus TaxID=84406 RepID=A0A024QF52_9BACI|nr:MULTISPECIES: hypothetical protein [Virgibacillus]EQB38995.1 hypothetical protein M948_01205 [Virgibacillus sp. CM-4]MYL43357.1 hypothetical protein [Virgibacillus massiliensis]GGJ68067.1 hypothetical protein GCM10007111_32380 [Virgibacillus kapii]CDQ41119.1 hypothetical protein BN990_03474 [Virgibacillus massiliensis]
MNQDSNSKRQVYLIFTDTGTLFTKLIKFYTRKPLNHASLSFSLELENMYSFGRKNPANPFIGGFVKENISEGLFRNAVCEVYSCNVTEFEYKKMVDKVNQMEQQKDRYRYNLIGMVALLFQFNIHRSNAFFCSQFVATILNELDNKLNKSANLCTPQDLRDMNNLTCIFKGELKNYPYRFEEKENEIELPSRKAI